MCETSNRVLLWFLPFLSLSTAIYAILVNYVATFLPSAQRGWKQKLKKGHHMQMDSESFYIVSLHYPLSSIVI